MRPKYKVDLLHSFEEYDIDEKVKWLLTNVGEPYPWKEDTSYGKQLDWEADGKWCCVAGSNKYTGKPSDPSLDTWWFSDEKDAVFFSLRFL